MTLSRTSNWMRRLNTNNSLIDNSFTVILTIRILHSTCRELSVDGLRPNDRVSAQPNRYGTALRASVRVQATLRVCGQFTRWSSSGATRSSIRHARTGRTRTVPPEVVRSCLSLFLRVARHLPIALERVHVRSGRFAEHFLHYSVRSERRWECQVSNWSS